MAPRDRGGSLEGGHRRPAQSGFLMAALAASIAVMVIFSTLAFQEWADVLRRDNEAEMMFRAKDLVRSIQRYRRDHAGVGPQKLEDLMKAGPRGQYYLRRLWKDPLVPDGKWGLLYIGPGGQIVDPNEEASPTGLEDAGEAGKGRAFSVFDKPKPDAAPPAPGALGPGAQPGGIGGAPSGPGTQPEQQQQFKSISADDPGADSSAGGKQISGLPIAGVKSLCKETPFRVYNGLTEYSDWRFTYLDLELPQVPGARGAQPGGPPMGKGKGKGFGKGRGL